MTVRVLILILKNDPYLTDYKGTKQSGYNCRVLEGLETAKCFGEYSLNNPVICRGLEAYGMVVKLKKTKTTSPACQCNWCLQDACEVSSRNVGSHASEAMGHLHLLMFSTHLYAL
ncbi:hypothetical protein MKW92_040966 [Papaver armeniacum]|nr:hypothetical protein MKW92_040966 [Papaver armeniacum]